MTNAVFPLNTHRRRHRRRRAAVNNNADFDRRRDREAVALCIIDIFVSANER